MERSVITIKRLEYVERRLPTGAAISTHRCWTCSRCREAFGLIGVVDIVLKGADSALPGGDGGGFHYDIEWTGVPRVLGGPVSRVIGLTDEAAWAAVEGLLA